MTSFVSREYMQDWVPKCKKKEMMWTTEQGPKDNYFKHYI